MKRRLVLVVAAVLVAAGGALVWSIASTDRASSSVDEASAIRSSGRGADVVARWRVDGRERIDSLRDADRKLPDRAVLVEGRSKGCRRQLTLTLAEEHVERLTWCVEAGAWRIEELEREVDVSGATLIETYACEDGPDLAGLFEKSAAFACRDGEDAEAKVTVVRRTQSDPMEIDIAFSGATRGSQRIEVGFEDGVPIRVEADIDLEIDVVGAVQADYRLELTMRRR